jgi:hypothetical protein
MGKYNFCAMIPVVLKQSVLVQACAGPEGSRRLRLPYLKRIDTLSALRTGRLYLPRRYSCHSFLLEADSTPGP